jgi:murein DD-endopeptidase MepM/ murein hydrolase activator NlpD
MPILRGPPAERTVAVLMCPRVAALLVAAALPLYAAPTPISVTARARAIRPGELVVLTITTVAPAEDVRARAFGHDLEPYRVSARVWRVLVGIDLDVTPGSHPVSIEAGRADHAETTTYRLAVKARAFPTRNLTVDEAFVNPPASVQPRIAEEAKKLAALWQASAPDRLWRGPFVRPVPDPANSAFGTRSVFNGQPRSPHSGADFLSPAGRPVKAPNAGRVVLAENLYYTGNTVVVDHGLGLFSLFAHLSVMNVAKGDRVTTGEVVGQVGATGRVTGPHLHWTVRAGGARIDPLSLLAVLGAAPGGER